MHDDYRNTRQISLFSRVMSAGRRRFGQLPLGGDFHCCICGQYSRYFLPYRGGAKAQPPLMTELGMTGSDLDHFSCPKCGSHDRERHLEMYFQRMGLFNRIKNAKVLHFAPEYWFSKRIRDQSPARYVMADLFPTNAEIIKMDMLDIPESSDTFDFVIANHVLEHVPDDLKALSEIVRVLKVGGVAILQTPFSPVLTRTFSDPGIVADSSRLHAYGQEDHVRLYGNDIFERFESAGLKSHVVWHKDIISDCDPFIEGVNPNEPFFMFMRE